jgi:hypothetical protein
MKTLNQLINDYTCLLKQGEVQVAYRGIIEFVGKLRADYTKNDPNYDVSSVYQGYMDMTYFSLSTKLLKEKGLKIAVVYLHDKGGFEVWLSARNRDISKSYASLLNSFHSDDMSVFHDDENPDAIMEYTLTSTPDFEDQASLIGLIEQGVEKFVTALTRLL